MKTQSQYSLIKRKIIYEDMQFFVEQLRQDYVKISFQDYQQLSEYICQKKLNRINTKTLIAALKKEESEIIRCQLKKQGDQYILIISILYEFLHQIKQIFEFKQCELSEQKIESYQRFAKLKKQKQKISQQLTKIISPVVQSGKIPKGNKQQIKSKIYYPTSVITFNLNFNQLRNNVVKFSFSYYDKILKQKIQTNKLPNLLYIQPSTEFRIACDDVSFEQYILEIQGQYSSIDYVITSQKVQDTTQHPKLSPIQILMRLGILIICYYGFSYFFASSSPQKGCNADL